MNIFTFTKLARVMLLSAVMVAVLVGTAVAQQKGTFKDSRDGQTYKTVVIGGKKWMAENLNYKTGNSWCNGDDDSNCEKYGRLYDWKTAMTACPRGWHLPTDEEYVKLAKAAGGTGNYGTSGEAGDMLKSSSGWPVDANGKDGFGFSALPGGFRGYSGSFDDPIYEGYWWTATKTKDGFAYSLMMSGHTWITFRVGTQDNYNSNAYSVRCVSN